jgi:hypothetical protein
VEYACAAQRSGCALVQCNSLGAHLCSAALWACSLFRVCVSRLPSAVFVSSVLACECLCCLCALCPVSHVVCIGVYPCVFFPRDFSTNMPEHKIGDALEGCKKAGITNIVALRGGAFPTRQSKFLQAAVAKLLFLPVLSLLWLSNRVRLFRFPGYLVAVSCRCAMLLFVCVVAVSCVYGCGVCASAVWLCACPDVRDTVLCP